MRVEYLIAAGILLGYVCGYFDGRVTAARYAPVIELGCHAGKPCFCADCRVAARVVEQMKERAS